jgi:hypothetical protein
MKRFRLFFLATIYLIFELILINVDLVRQIHIVTILLTHIEGV